MSARARISPTRRWPPRPAALAPVALVAIACASAPAPPPAAPLPQAERPTQQAAAPAPDPAALQALYTDLQSQIEAFEAGIRLLQEGRDEIGSAQLAAASARLRQGAADCSRTAGCDIDLFVGAYDYLLEEQATALRAVRLAEAVEPADGEAEREPGTEPFHGEMPELDRSLNLLKGTDLSELIELNGPVRAALDDWLTWMRPNLRTAWYNYQFLRPEMAPVYEQAGLPEALLFGILAAESGGKVHAMSRAGAAGPLQFIRATGRRYGLVERDGFDLRFDPEAATRANVAYINEYLAAFNDSLEKVLAAYNGGEGRMQRIQRGYGAASFWDRRVYYQFPRETREYVPRVLAAAWLFLHPERYGLELPAIDTSTTTLALSSEIALNELAVCVGDAGNPDGWFRTLRNLNPRLGPGDRLEVGTEVRLPAVLVPAYEERCVEGPLLAEARLLHDANYPEEPEMIPYTVRQGDSLGRIAARFPCVSVRELAAVNGVRPPRYTIRAGQRLKIPTCG